MAAMMQIGFCASCKRFVAFWFGRGYWLCPCCSFDKTSKELLTSGRPDAQ